MGTIDVKEIVKCVKKVMDDLNSGFMVEASGRHVHLSEADALALFGTKDLEKLKDLSQPGQYAAKHVVTLVGKKGVINDVRVLGPCRSKTQVEISMTDARTLGVKPLIRESGDVKGAPNIILCSGENAVVAKESTIVAKRHIHMQSTDAQNLGVKDREIVKVSVTGDRPVIFDDVVVRVNDSFRLSMHIDYDEANAVGLSVSSKARIVKA